MIKLYDIFGSDIKDRKPNQCTRIGIIEGPPFIRRCRRTKSPGKDLCREHVVAKIKGL